MAAGELTVPNIQPGETKEVELPRPFSDEMLAKAKASGSEVIWTVHMKLRNSTRWAETGHEVAWAQHKAGNSRQRSRLYMSLLQNRLNTQVNALCMHTKSVFRTLGVPSPTIGASMTHNRASTYTAIGLLSPESAFGVHSHALVF